MLYNISQAAALANMHPQTLRQYDRLGIVVPKKTRGLSRRYSAYDIARLLEVQRLSISEGINLEGIRKILELEEEVNILRRQLEALKENIVFAAGSDGSVIISKQTIRRQPLPAALIEWI